MDIPPIIANRVLKRQPLNIVYVRKHLTQRQRELQSSLSLPTSTAEEKREGGEEAQSAQFEDAVPVRDFIRDSWRTRRTASDPRHK